MLLIFDMHALSVKMDATLVLGCETVDVLVTSALFKRLYVQDHE